MKYTRTKIEDQEKLRRFVKEEEQTRRDSERMADEHALAPQPEHKEEDMLELKYTQDEMNEILDRR